MPATSLCPCGSDENFAECCQPCLTSMTAATAEQLMRSRYTAYTLGREDYLLATWHPSTRPAQLGLGNEPVKWLGLKILSSTDGATGDKQGQVEFIARYKLNGKAQRIHENSRFIFEHGSWFYIDGQMQ